MREDDVLLIDFCKRQYQTFNSDEWLSNVALSAQLKIAALFLKSSRWYKHEQELTLLCQHWELQSKQLPNLIKQQRFDCARFAAMLKKQIQLSTQGLR